MLRRTPLRRANPERRQRLREEQFGPHGDRVRALPCAACGALPPSDPHHHEHTRGAGGKWKHIVPLCRRCHNAVDAPWGGKETFEREHGVDLTDLARRLAAASGPATEADETALRQILRRIPVRVRGAMLSAAPFRVPRSVRWGEVGAITTWARTQGWALELARVLDLWAALQDWRETTT